MSLAIDTHVHIYPFYDTARALDALLDNLAKADASSERIGCLTERYDCHLYTELAESPDAGLLERFEIEKSRGSLRIRRLSDGASCDLLPGQQVITGENIEILSLACETRVAEGKPAPDTVRAILAEGGVPVAAWAPGKWFFKRGKVVRALLDAFEPGELALGDTTLRPVGWLTPLIIREARSRGFRVLYGSDPLPYIGEECRPGSYHSRVESEVGNSVGVDPSERVRSLLNAAWRIEPAGGRGSFPEVLNRLYRNSRAPKPARTG